MKPREIVRTTLAALVVLTALGATTPAAAQAKRPMTESDRKDVDRLQADVKQVDIDGALASTTLEGRRTVSDGIARQFKVQESVVDGLRNRKLGYGGVTIALALSQAMMKKDSSLTQQAALDSILARRGAGQGWGVIAHSEGVKLGPLISEVKKAEKHVDRAKAVKIEKPERPVKAGR